MILAQTLKIPIRRASSKENKPCLLNNGGNGGQKSDVGCQKSDVGGEFTNNRSN